MYLCKWLYLYFTIRGGGDTQIQRYAWGCAALMGCFLQEIPKHWSHFLQKYPYTWVLFLKFPTFSCEHLEIVKNAIFGETSLKMSAFFYQNKVLRLEQQTPLQTKSEYPPPPPPVHNNAAGLSFHIIISLSTAAYFFLVQHSHPQEVPRKVTIL